MDSRIQLPASASGGGAGVHTPAPRKSKLRWPQREPGSHHQSPGHWKRSKHVLQHPAPPCCPGLGGIPAPRAPSAGPGPGNPWLRLVPSGQHVPVGPPRAGSDNHRHNGLVCRWACCCPLLEAVRTAGACARALGVGRQSIYGALESLKAQSTSERANAAGHRHAAAQAGTTPTRAAPVIRFIRIPLPRARSLATLQAPAAKAASRLFWIRGPGMQSGQRTRFTREELPAPRWPCPIPARTGVTPELPRG